MLLQELDPGDYWFETARRVARENYLDRLAARAMNADNVLRHQVPFGTPPGDNPRLSA